jgi:hypothetical protein
MPRVRRRGKAKSGELTQNQYWDLLLGGRVGTACETCEIRLTCINKCWEFATHKERRAAWMLHGNELMGDTNEGTRPSAWWDFSAPPAARELHAAGQRDADVLRQFNLLGEAEKMTLDAWERTSKPAMIGEGEPV